MIREKARAQLIDLREHCADMRRYATRGESIWDDDVKALEMALKALEQEPCEMTVEEYRQRMIQAFHNADTDELIAICVLPTEKEFEHLEWLLKTHYPNQDTFVISNVECKQILEYLMAYKDVTDKCTKKNLCDSCVTEGCIFQSGVVRNHCNFYKAEYEEVKDVW